jgi:biotin carboxyl carrier protein
MSARWVTWIDDEAATVELAVRDGTTVRARIEGASGVREVAFTLPVRHPNGECLMRDADGQAIAAWIGPEGGPRGVRTIAVRGRDIEVRARRELDAWLAAGDEGAGSGAVSVSMPGRVVKVLAKVGDQVEKGAPVLIIEAMKMENEVKAKRSGAVQAVHVAEGDAVEGGFVLMEIG